MLCTACCCFCFNLIQMKILDQDDEAPSAGTEENGQDADEEEKKESNYNINVDAAFIHAIGDMFLSLGVCISATVIYFRPDLTIADPICTFMFSIIICCTAFPVIKNCVQVLMEGAPVEID